MRKISPFLLSFMLACSNSEKPSPKPAVSAKPIASALPAPKVEKKISEKPKVKKEKDEKCEAEKKCGLVLPRTALIISEGNNATFHKLKASVWSIRVETDDKCRVKEEKALILLDDTKGQSLVQAPVEKGSCVKLRKGCAAVKVEDITYDMSKSCEVTQKKIRLSVSASRR